MFENSVLRGRNYREFFAGSSRGVSRGAAGLESQLRAAPRRVPGCSSAEQQHGLRSPTGLPCVFAPPRSECGSAGLFVKAEVPEANEGKEGLGFRVRGVASECASLSLIEDMIISEPGAPGACVQGAEEINGGSIVCDPEPRRF